MSYTHINISSKHHSLTPGKVLGGFLVVITLVVFALLGLNYHRIDTSNRVLGSKIAKMSGTTPVSAISSPDAREDMRGSLQPVDKAEVADLIEKIRTIALVPVDEAPTLATIIDITKILDQPFFRNAQVDDKLFVYTAARTAVLYRPAEGKLVNMAYLVDTDSSSKDVTSAPTRPQVQGVSNQASSGAQLRSKIAVYYATDSAQLRSKVGKALLSVPDVEISQEALTRNPDYRGITVIDVKGGHTELMTVLIRELQGVRGTMPSEEDIPRADVLIIAGE